MKVTVNTEGGSFTVENDSIENVGALLALVGPTFGIAPNANLAVNGRNATAATPLADGDEVSTTKPAGRKGRKVVVRARSMSVTLIV